MMLEDIESFDDMYVPLEEENRRLQDPHATPTQAAMDILSGALGVKDSPPKPIPIQHLPGDNDTTLLDDPILMRSVPIRPIPPITHQSTSQLPRSSSRAKHGDRVKESIRDTKERSEPRKTIKTKDSIRQSSQNRKGSSTRKILEELNLHIQTRDTRSNTRAPTPSITESHPRPHSTRPAESQTATHSNHPQTTKDTPFATYSRARTTTTTGRSSDSITTMLAVTSERLAQERRRADEAEKQASEVLRLLKEVVETKGKAEREVRTLRDERELWRVRLEEAQAEIFRAQSVVAQIDKQRVDAESEAQRLRDKLRKVYEERAVDNARDEGRKAGFEEGLRHGRFMSMASAQEKEEEEEEERERERERKKAEQEERRREEQERRKREKERERRQEEERRRREIEDARDREEKRKQDELEKKLERDRKRREEAERIANERLMEQQEKKTETATLSSRDSSQKAPRPRRQSTARNPLHHPPSLPAPPQQPSLRPSFPAPMTMPQPSVPDIIPHSSTRANSPPVTMPQPSIRVHSPPVTFPQPSIRTHSPPVSIPQPSITAVMPQSSRYVTMPQPSIPASQYQNPLPRLPTPSTPSNLHSPPQQKTTTSFIPMMRPDSTFDIPPAHDFITPPQNSRRGNMTPAPPPSSSSAVPRKSTAQREPVQLRDPGYTSTPHIVSQHLRSKTPGAEKGIYRNPRMRDEDDDEERERERIRQADRDRRFAVVGGRVTAPAWESPVPTEEATEIDTSQDRTRDQDRRDTMYNYNTGDSTRFSEMQMLASPMSTREEVGSTTTRSRRSGVVKRVEGMGSDAAYRHKVAYGRPSTRDSREDEDESMSLRDGVYNPRNPRVRTRSEVDPTAARQWRVTNTNSGGADTKGGMYGNPRRPDTNEQVEPQRRNYSSPSMSTQTPSSRPREVVLPVPLMNTLVGANFTSQSQRAQRHNPLQFNVQPARSPRIGGQQAIPVHGSSHSPRTQYRQNLAPDDYTIQYEGPRRPLERSGSNVSEVPGINVETPSSHGDGMHLEEPHLMDPVMLTPEVHSSPLPTSQEIDGQHHQHHQHQQHQQQHHQHQHQHHNHHQQSGLGLYTPQAAASNLNLNLRVDTHRDHPTNDDRDAKRITGVVNDGNFPPGFVPLSPIPLFDDQSRTVMAA